MTRNQMLHHAIRLMDGGGPQELYDLGAWAARQLLDGATLDTLHALILAGPVWDGDLPSKTGRNTLVELGLAAKCVCKGQQGFQVATYRGWNVYYAQIDSAMNGASIGAQVMPAGEIGMTISDAVKRARGGEAPPPPMQGFA